MHRVLAAVGDRLNLPVRDAELIRLHSNAIYALPDAGLVIRIATNPDALPRVTAAVHTTHWLAAHGFPCTRPAGIDGQPLVEQDHVVSIWRYVPTVSAPHPTPTDLGRLLRALHQHPMPPAPPAEFGDPFASVSRAVRSAPDALPDDQRTWLLRRIDELRRYWQALDFPHPPCLIHGDAHPNNLLRRGDGTVLLGDWDHVAHGPREWDVAQPHYTHRRFGHPSQSGLRQFATEYGWDIRDWPGLDILIAVREITGLSPYVRSASTNPFSRQELAHRLDTLERGQVATPWSPPRGGSARR